MPSKRYFRPLAQSGLAHPKNALPLAGGPIWFSHVECLRRNHSAEVISVKELPKNVLDILTAPLADICGLSLGQPRLMGVLNATPDSFSDGGLFASVKLAALRGAAMIGQGADLVDVGGESTRPGAQTVNSAVEISRTEPLIAALHNQFPDTAISIDTRKSDVAAAALAAGAGLVNDVSALGFDAEMARVLANSQAALCLTHSGGSPDTMQDAPAYIDVLLDVYDYLENRIKECAKLGISKSRILVDPGIGFGKTLAHNLALIRGLSLFHGLGCGVLLGVSRKGFIGKISGEADARARTPGSIAVGLEGLRQGVQMLRVHDISETRQAIDLWQATR